MYPIYLPTNHLQATEEQILGCGKFNRLGAFDMFQTISSPSRTIHNYSDL